jgi:hypothetical protein
LREISNLQIALNAISARYPDDANEIDFTDFLVKSTVVEPANTNKMAALEMINYTRRKHHYNFLSMNEIFTMPPLETDSSNRKETFTEKVLIRKFWLPFVIYLLIFANDLSTFDIGKQISISDTIVGLIVSLIFLLLIAFFARKCTKLQSFLSGLYSTFKEQNYKYARKFTKQ